MTYYNRTNTCDRCGKSFENIGWQNPRREYNKENNWTGKWVCKSCYTKNYNKSNSNSCHNLVKSLRNCRTGNLDPNCCTAIGNKSQDLACKLYNWVDLNKQNDNYTTGTPIDCYDSKTGLYHQVEGRLFNRLSGANGGWPFSGIEREWKKLFEDMICFCYSKDGKIVERIYKFPKEELIGRTNITIIKNPMNKHGTSSIIPWYEKYRVNDKEELKMVNNL